MPGLLRIRMDSDQGEESSARSPGAKTPGDVRVLELLQAMRIHDDIEQGSDEWLRIRAGRATASQFSRILTATGKPSSQSDDYIVELVGECAAPDAPAEFQGNFATRRGHELEPLARNWFADQVGDQGLEVREVGFVTRDDGVIGCSPDALIYRDDKLVAGLEIKCPLSKKRHISPLLAGQMPDEHKPQVHGSMAVCAVAHWYFLSWFPGLCPLVVLVHRDGFTDQLEDALDSFYQRYEDEHFRLISQLVDGPVEIPTLPI